MQQYYVEKPTMCKISIGNIKLAAAQYSVQYTLYVWYEVWIRKEKKRRSHVYYSHYRIELENGLKIMITVYLEMTPNEMRRDEIRLT